MRTAPLLAAPLLLVLPAGVRAADPPKRPWSDKASLGFVAVGGNATSQSLGASNEYKYAWDEASLAFDLSGVRVAATAVDRTAAGPSLAAATVTEARTTTTSTETYRANLRFDHRLSERMQWFGSAGWERNRPAGLEGRTTLLGGLGYWWLKEGGTRVFTDAGLGYTREQLVFRPPDTKAGFTTFRFSARVEQVLLAASQFTSELAVTDGFEDTRNYLAVWRNAFSTAISPRLALKISCDVTYRNQPASVGVDVLQTPLGTPPVVLGQVPYRLRKTDTVFSTSLVLNL